MKILALDGNSLAYRAFFALPTDMVTSQGQVTNALFGFTSMFCNLVREQAPDAVVVVFDRAEPTFRHEAAPEYKAQREEQPDILYEQLDLLRELLAAMGVTTIDAPGYEGDDLIATIAARVRAAGDDLVIVTGDRDAYQLVRDPHVRVMYNKRGVSDYALYDEAGILERTGVTPAQYPDYAALRGDASDNLAGVPGVGEKTAAKLIQRYGSLAAVFDHAAEQTPKLRASLEEHRERVMRNAGLMRLRDDAPLSADPRTARPRPDAAAVRRMFELFEFRTMHARFADAMRAMGVEPEGAAGGPSDGAGAAGGPSDGAGDAAGDAGGASGAVGDGAALAIRDAVDPADAAAALAAIGPVALGAGWTGEAGRSGLAGVAVVTPRGGEATWIAADLLGSREVRDALGAITSYDAHDAKPMLRALLAAGIDVDALGTDTAIAAYLLDPSEGTYAVADVAARHAAVILPSPSGAPAEEGRLDLDGADPSAVARESAAVAALGAAVAARALDRAMEAQGLAPLYRDVERPLVRVLARMEDLGVGVDAGTLRAIRDRLAARCAELTASLHATVGREFNLNSPVQLRQILYEERKLTPGRKTKTGYSTDAATLERLRGEWPEFVEPLLEFREVEKLRSTYGEGLLAEVAADGRIHATFNQTVARTGRLSSDRPNLHNIPVRTEAGRVFREAFVPRPGHELLVADYNQIELRCIAHLAQDPGLIGAFTRGEDVHTATASRVFGVDPADVTIGQRSQAKMVSYGLAYGMEAYGLAQRLGIGVGEADGILTAYFAAFPKVRAYMDGVVAEARNRGYTVTLFGRRRPIPELLSPNRQLKQVGERQAMNSGIQGLAADIFKVALVRIDRALSEAGLQARIVLQVHDEVIVEAPAGERARVEPLVLDTMRGAATLDVPLEVNAAWGSSWAGAKS
ncbi:MAG: DNA polymerase I [Acidimicrobiia bacterium]